MLGFNVRAEGKATELANREGVDIRYYTVIYQAIDEIEKALKGMLKPEFEEVELGRPRSARSSGPPSSATSPAASCAPARSAATPRPGCCGTAW